MAARGNRTVLCSVVFIDIVEYSKKSVEEQMLIKQQFNALLLRALQTVPADDRIILDTGDGAAINFLGDPEECLFVAIALRDALAARNDERLRIRVGINLGPVRLVKDINGQPNIIGDGINVAQRIMSFADVNQILVSRSFYELISALSADYAHLFAFEGARTDKHVREHEVYALGKSPAPHRVVRKAPTADAPRGQGVMRRLEFAAASAQAHVMRRPPLATALTVGAILMTAVVLRVSFRDASPGVAPTPVSQTPLEAAQRTPEPPLPSREVRPAPTHKAVPEAEPRPAPPRVADTPAPPSTTATPQVQPDNEQRAQQRPQLPAATGIVRLNVQPWGEVYVDGRKFGVAPPLRDIALEPGTHRIEVRNPGFPAHAQVVEVKAREEIRIRHRFQ